MGALRMTFMIFGAGYSAQAFAKKTRAKIYGTTRSESNFQNLKAAHIQPLLFSENHLSAPLNNALKTTTHFLISISPDEQGDIVLRNHDIMSQMPKLEWIGYLSTIGVYGNSDGKWIDETALCHPTLIRNQVRLDVEKAWQSFADKEHIPLAILRLGGIYGSGRNAFVKLQQGQARRIIKQGQVFNRIHCDDIAGVIEQFSTNKTAGLFNVVDNEPAPPQDVISYAAELTGTIPPAEVAFEDAKLSPMAQSFYSDNKRISNQKLSLTGYKFQYPTYRDALQFMWANNQWQ